MEEVLRLLQLAQLLVGGWLVQVGSAELHRLQDAVRGRCPLPPLAPAFLADVPILLFLHSLHISPGIADHLR